MKSSNKKQENSSRSNENKSRSEAGRKGAEALRGRDYGQEYTNREESGRRGAEPGWGRDYESGERHEQFDANDEGEFTSGDSQRYASRGPFENRDENFEVILKP